MDSTGPPVLKPLARRPWALSSTSSSETPTPLQTNLSSSSTHDSPSTFADHPSDSDQSDPVSRNKSILNLTSSTLFGIYAPTASGENTSTPPTPWGTGAETPSHRGSEAGLTLSPLAKQRGIPSGDELEQRLLRSSGRIGSLSSSSFTAAGKGELSPGEQLKSKQSRAPILWQVVLSQSVLFALGVAYGALILRLRDNKHISPLPTVRAAPLNSTSIAYLVFWGLSGVGMGNLLPWIDGQSDGGKGSVLDGVEWSHVVRSIGAFVGVTFAIRRLPWETTMQLSLTLALTNPFLWYLLDRTAAGLALSSAIGVFGTAALLAINPELIPAPTSHFASEFANHTTASMAGLEKLNMHDGYVGVATWIASVLFCSCVCFGNIGRLLVSKS